jgi:hypothetical protein
MRYQDSFAEGKNGKTILSSIGDTIQLIVYAAEKPDGFGGDVTRQALGTTYVSSNPSVVSVSIDGLVTAFTSLTEPMSIIITARNEGVTGTMLITVAPPFDRDADGISNDCTG